MAVGDEFRDHADGDLGRRAATEREADRCADPREVRLRTSHASLSFEHAPQDRVHFASRADHAEVSVGSAQQVGQGTFVSRVVVRHDQHVVTRVEVGQGDVQLVDVVGPGLHARERWVFQQRFALVQDREAEVGGDGQGRQSLRDVAGSDHDQSGLGLQVLHEHLHCAATTHGQVADEVGLHLAGAPFSNRGLAGGDHLGFDRPATDRSHQGAVLVQQELGAHALRGGPAASGHGGHGRALAPTFEDIDDLARQHGRGHVAAQWGGGHPRSLPRWYGASMVRWLAFAGVCCGLVACADPGPALCEGNPGGDVEVDAFYRFAETPLQDGDALPVFIPPQGGIATELDVDLYGVGLDTVETLEVQAVRGGGERVAQVSYTGGGLPLECVMHGQLKVRALPVPFDDSISLESLDALSVQLVVRLTRSDGHQGEVVHAVTLDVAEY